MINAVVCVPCVGALFFLTHLEGKTQSGVTTWDKWRVEASPLVKDAVNTYVLNILKDTLTDANSRIRSVFFALWSATPGCSDGYSIVHKRC